jgi:hypothetical protein
MWTSCHEIPHYLFTFRIPAMSSNNNMAALRISEAGGELVPLNSGPDILCATKVDHCKLCNFCYGNFLYNVKKQDCDHINFILLFLGHN